MLPATSLLIGFVALVGAMCARVARRGPMGSLDRAGQVIAGLAIGLGAALAILIPRIDVVQDGTEPFAAAVGLAVAALAFVASWAWLARE